MKGNRFAVNAVLLLVACGAVGAAVGFSIPSTREVDQKAFVLVTPQSPSSLQQAGVLDIKGPRPPDVVSGTFKRGSRNLRAQRIAGVDLAVAGGEGISGLRRALTAAYIYIRSTTRLQDKELRRLVAGAGPEARAAQAARRALATPASRFEATYTVLASDAESGAPFRGALLGLLFGGVVLAGSAFGGVVARPRRRALPPWPWLAERPAATVVASMLGAAAVAGLAGVGPGRAFTFLGGVLFATAAITFALRGERETRWLLATVILITPFRGAVLSLLKEIGAPGSDLAVNAIQPVLILAATMGLLALGRSRARATPAGLILALIAIAAVCALSFLTQTVGLTVYAIGLAQYLTYPVFAIVLWQALGPDEGRRLAGVLIWLAIGVAISVAMQAAGLVSFSESVSGEGLSTPRYGGATGSFIHASIFLGTAIPILAGWLLAQRSRAGVVQGAIGLAVLLGGLALTFGRAGVGIAAIGLVLLFLASSWRTRLQILAVAAAALAIAIPASWAAGRSPSGLADRLAGVVDPDDPGNEARIRGQEHALNTFRDAPPSEKALGNGLASTGNARKLASLGSASTESFVLKLLVETGLVGLIAIGAVLIWTAAVFLRLCFSSVPPLAKGVGAAGFGLFVDGFLFQTLEVQLIAMTWWLMLVIALRERRLSRP